jgi:hypothetical protein
MAQADIGLPVTKETRVLSQIIHCETWGEQSDTGTGYSPSTSVFSLAVLLLHTPLRIHVALTRRTNGRNLGTCQQCHRDGGVLKLPGLGV